MRDPKLFKAALFEYEIARTLSHPNICPMLAWFATSWLLSPCSLVSPAWTLHPLEACHTFNVCRISFRASSTEFVLVQEYAPNGDLLSCLKTARSLSDAAISRYFSQLVCILVCPAHTAYQLTSLSSLMQLAICMRTVLCTVTSSQTMLSLTSMVTLRFVFDQCSFFPLLNRSLLVDGLLTLIFASVAV